jgi:hypothetical protein
VDALLDGCEHDALSAVPRGKERPMTDNVLRFDVTGLDVTVPEGFHLQWQGREIDSGPVTVALGEPGSGGVIDYATGRVNVEFRVRISFPELAEALADMGAEADLTAPVEAVIRSEGVVFDDRHSLRLAGKGQIGEHRLFDRDETKLEILAPTRCCADAGSLSGDDIKAALRRGEPMTWKFNPTEKRVVLVMPEMLGGQSHLLCLVGSYTFTAKPEDATAAVAPPNVAAA